jgi:hypothetical protein
MEDLCFVAPRMPAREAGLPGSASVRHVDSVMLSLAAAKSTPSFRMPERQDGRSEYYLDMHYVAMLSHTCLPFLSLRFMASITRMLKMRSSFTKHVRIRYWKRREGLFL